MFVKLNYVLWQFATQITPFLNSGELSLNTELYTPVLITKADNRYILPTIVGNHSLLTMIRGYDFVFPTNNKTNQRQVVVKYKNLNSRVIPTYYISCKRYLTHN